MPSYCQNTVRILTRSNPQAHAALVKRVKSCTGNEEVLYDEYEGLFKELLEHDEELDLDSGDWVMYAHVEADRPDFFQFYYTSYSSPHPFDWARVSAKYDVDINICYRREDQTHDGLAFCTPDKLRIWQSLLDYTSALNSANLEHCDEYLLKNDEFLIQAPEGHAHA